MKKSIYVPRVTVVEDTPKKDYLDLLLKLSPVELRAVMAEVQRGQETYSGAVALDRSSTVAKHYKEMEFLH